MKTLEFHVEYMHFRLFFKYFEVVYKRVYAYAHAYEHTQIHVGNYIYRPSSRGRRHTPTFRATFKMFIL
jgi:hypothetical protein